MAGTAIKRTSHSTSRLILRPYQAGDYETWRSAYADRLPKRNRWDRDPSPQSSLTRRKFQELRARHDRLAKNDRVYVYGMFLKRTGVLVGAIDIAVLVRMDRQLGNLGYQLHNRHWGKGYAREAVIAAIRIAFHELNLHRLEAAVDLRNTRSLILARAVGMEYEGIKRGYLFEGGKWVDQHVFAITR